MKDIRYFMSLLYDVIDLEKQLELNKDDEQLKKDVFRLKKELLSLYIGDSNENN